MRKAILGGLWFLGILLSGVSVYLFFKSFFDVHVEGYSLEIVAALLGSVFTAIITGALLFQQSRSEEVRERNVEVFRVKIRLYEQLIEVVDRVLKDGKVTAAELNELHSWYNKLYMVAGEPALEAMGEFFAQLKRWPVASYGRMTPGQTKNFENAGKKEEDFLIFADVLDAIRADIGVAGMGLPMDVWEKIVSDDGTEADTMDS